MIQTVLRANAASCLIFGFLFVLMPVSIAGFLGDPPVPVIFILGILLVLNGSHLVWASLRRAPALEILYFSAGDFLWVAVTMILIALGIWITKPPGIIAALAVAAIVGLFGVLQIISLSRESKARKQE